MAKAPVLKANAIQVLKLAAAEADAKGVVNPWVNEIRRELNRLLPKEFPHLRDGKRIDANPRGTLPQVERELR